MRTLPYRTVALKMRLKNFNPTTDTDMHMRSRKKVLTDSHRKKSHTQVGKRAKQRERWQSSMNTTVTAILIGEC